MTTAAEKRARKEAARAEAFREEVAADLVRQPALRHLLQGSKPLPAPLYRVALDVHRLWMMAQGRMRTSDWMKERVDGGGMKLDVDIVGALDASHALRHALAESRMGEAAETVVLAICGEGWTVSGYAVAIETDPVARGSGGCAASTREWVSRLLRHGLARLLKDRTIEGDSAVGPELRRIKAWLGEGAQPAFGATKLGKRPDLVQPGGAIHRRA